MEIGRIAIVAGALEERVYILGEIAGIIRVRGKSAKDASRALRSIAKTNTLPPRLQQHSDLLAATCDDAVKVLQERNEILHSNVFFVRWEGEPWAGWKQGGSGKTRPAKLSFELLAETRQELERVEATLMRCFMSALG